MKRLLSIAIALLVLLNTQIAWGKTVHADPARTLILKGVVGEDFGIDIAQQLEMLSIQSTDPVWMVINSPGGSILQGMVIMSAMELVKQRGIEINCVVPVYAASMAMHIFGACTNRYAFDFSLLLWHRGKMGGEYNAEDATAAAADLARMERMLDNRLRKALRLSRKVYNYHLKHETFHRGEDLKRLSPQFMTIIDDVDGLPEGALLFTL